MREHTLFRKSAHFVEVIIILQKNVSKELERKRRNLARLNRNPERLPRKRFRCGSEDHINAKCPKPPKKMRSGESKYVFMKEVNRACNNGKENNDHKIYASMARMYSNNERKNVKYGDSLQLTNWILDLGETCHMTPEVSDFIPGTLEDTDKCIEVADGHHVTAKKKVKYKYKCVTIAEINSSQPYTTYF